MKNLENAAKELGLKLESKNGRVQISGRLSEVLRAWAMAGYDRKQTWDGEKTKSWAFYLNGEYAGECDTIKGENLGYSFTSRA